MVFEGMPKLGEPIHSPNFILLGGNFRKWQKFPLLFQ